MTVQTNTNVASFNGDGANKVFPIGYKFNSAADLVALLVDDVAVTTQILTLNSDFTVTGAGDEEGGTVTLEVAPTANQRLTIIRIVDILQLTDLRNQGKFYAEVHEDAFDLLTMIAQQHKSDIALSLRVAETDPEPARIPSVAQRAGKLLSFDAGGNPTTALPVTDSSTELRQELAGSNGAAMIGRGVVSVASIADLVALSADMRREDLIYLVSEYHAGSGVGGGKFRWVETNSEPADGGAIIAAADVTQGRFLQSADQVNVWSYGVVNSLTESQSARIQAYIRHQVANLLCVDFTGVKCLLTGAIEIPQAPTPTHKRFIGGHFFSGENYTDQVEFMLNGPADSFTWDGVTADGGRGVKPDVQDWTVFSSAESVSSIQPANTVRFLRTPVVQNNAEINIINSKFKNFHAESVVKVWSDGVVRFINNVWENCANKSWNTVHDLATGKGVTFTSKERFKDIGILPDQFSVDGVAQEFATTAYMPQGSFNALCTYGTFIASDMDVHGYGSTGITADRNKLFLFNNINIICDNIKALSNNPTGGFWDESCEKAIGSNVYVEVSKRDSRDAGDSSCVQVYKEESEEFYGVNIVGVDLTNRLKKIIRLSTKQNSIVSIESGRTSSADGTVPGLTHGTLSGVAANVTLTNMEIRGSLTIRDSNIVQIKGGSRRGDTLIDTINTTAKLSLVSIEGGSASGLTIANNVERLKVSGLAATRRVEARNVEIVDIGGNTIQTAVAEPAIWVNPNASGVVKRAFVHDNMIRIVSGTTGAGYLTFNANVGTGLGIDQGNDKATY